MPTKKSASTFADNLASLEQIIAALEDNETSLETSITEFEKGIKIVKSAQQELTKTELKVQQLLESGGQDPVDEAVD